MSRELIYLTLIFALLVVPRVLQRFKIPAPITSLAMGMMVMLVWPEETGDAVVILLSTLGISSLFLFAGLEVDVTALRRGMRELLMHLLIRVITLFATGWVAWYVFGLGVQVSALIALALWTPSTGFILDTLHRLGLNEEERFWVTSKAIAGEILALGLLFMVLLANDPQQLAVSSLAILGMVVGLPLVFIALGRWVVPHAPGSEFSLLVMVGMVAAYLTYKLGVYYLVGAFIAGLIARLLYERLPSLASEENLHAMRLFASFFVPFYFFHAGMEVPAQALSMDALWIGLALIAVVLPLRIGTIWLQRRVLFRGEDSSSTGRVAVALAPTLVFTLVLAGILRARFGISDELFGGLLVYTTLNTMLPSLVLRSPFDLDPLLVEGVAWPAPTSPNTIVATVNAEVPAPEPLLEGLGEHDEEAMKKEPDSGAATRV